LSKSHDDGDVDDDDDDDDDDDIIALHHRSSGPAFLSHPCTFLMGGEGAGGRKSLLNIKSVFITP